MQKKINKFNQVSVCGILPHRNMHYMRAASSQILCVRHVWSLSSSLGYKLFLKLEFMNPKLRALKWALEL